MTKHLRIATWNLDRSGIRRKSRIQPQLDKICEINADLWVLTETHSAIALPGYESLASERDPEYHEEGESCVTIWSRWPLREISASILTVCGEFQLPFSSAKMLAYGTIIPWRDDGVREGAAQPWERHREAVKQQTKEWLKLRTQYPEHVLCVAGDFNENLAETRGYGVADAKLAIKHGLESASMRCLTQDNLRAPPFNLSRATVDHICVSNNLHATVRVEAWEGTISGMKLSDHNGVLVDLEIPDA
jgi:hypothetical protein